VSWNLAYRPDPGGASFGVGGHHHVGATLARSQNQDLYDDPARRRLSVRNDRSQPVFLFKTGEREPDHVGRKSDRIGAHRSEFHETRILPSAPVIGGKKIRSNFPQPPQPRAPPPPTSSPHHEKPRPKKKGGRPPWRRPSRSS